MGKLLIEELTPAQFWTRAGTPSPDGCGNQSVNNRAEEKWDLGAGYDKSLDLGRWGWAEGTRKVMAVSAHVDQIISKVIDAPGLEYDVTGELPDVGAMLSGQPEYMMGMAETKKEAPVVRVIVNAAASCNVSAETMLARGVIACSLVDALEKTGTQCEFIVSMAFAEKRPIKEKGGYLVRTVAKRAGEPMNMDRVAFMAAHPAYFRRLGFRLLETCPDKAIAEKLTNWGYGYPDKEEGDKGDIVIEELYDKGKWSAEDCAEEVKKYLRKAGVELHELA